MQRREIGTYWVRVSRLCEKKRERDRVGVCSTCKRKSEWDIGGECVCRICDNKRVGAFVGYVKGRERMIECV